MKVEPLEPLFFFFIIKAEKVKPEFKVAYKNEVWAYINFMSEAHATKYYSMLEKTGLKSGLDFYAACFDGAPWSKDYFNPTKNDWIEFDLSGDGCTATYVGEK